MRTSSEGLVRGLGLLALTSAVFNCTVGGGIFRLPASVYAIVGSASPLVYLICFSIMSLVAMVFIQVGKNISATGGPYAYVRPILGPYWGFLCGVLLWALAVFAMASIANAYANFVGQAFPVFSSGIGEAFTIAVTFLFLALFNIKGVKSGAHISIFLSVVKIAPLLLIIGFGIPHLSDANLALPSPLPADGLARGSMLLIFAFAGCESALIPSGEINNPAKNLSRALFGGLFLVLFLYLGVQTVSQSVLGSELGTPGGFPLATTADRIMGPWGGWVIRIGAVFSTLGYLSAITLSLPRSLYAFAKDGFLPSFLAKVDPVHHTPSSAIIVQVCIAWALAISNQFEKLAVLSNLSAMLMYILCAIAALKMMSEHRASRLGSLRSLIPISAIMAMGYLLTSVTSDEWISVAGLVVVASAGYFWKKRGKR